MYQYAEQLPLKEKMWSDLGEELEAQLLSSVAVNLKFNKLPVPRDQLIKKRLKVGHANLFSFSFSDPLPPFHPYLTIGLLYFAEKYCPYQGGC